MQSKEEPSQAQKFVTFRMNEDDYEKLRKSAADLRLSVSALIRMIVCREVCREK
jgi:hypothetical protein